MACFGRRRQCVNFTKKEVRFFYHAFHFKDILIENTIDIGIPDKLMLILIVNTIERSFAFSAFDIATLLRYLIYRYFTLNTKNKAETIRSINVEDYISHLKYYE